MTFCFVEIQNESETGATGESIVPAIRNDLKPNDGNQVHTKTRGLSQTEYVPKFIVLSLGSIPGSMKPFKLH